MMCNDGSEERIWLTFGRQTLTGMDKLTIMKGVCVCVCVCAYADICKLHASIANKILMCCIMLQAKC